MTMRNFKNIHPKDLAVTFQKANLEEQNHILTTLPNHGLAAMFIFLTDEGQKELFSLLNNKKQKELLDLLSIDDLKEFIDLFKKDEKDKIITLLKRAKRSEIIARSNFKTNQAAAIMSPHFITININDDIKTATHKVTTQSKLHDHIELIFVVDDYLKFIGTISLTKLISARPQDKLINIVNTSSPNINGNDQVKRAAKYIRDYDLPSLAVVNNRHEIIGIITHDDAFEIMQDDFEDAFNRLASIGDFDTTQSPFKRTKDRIIWLLLSVVLNVIIALVLSRYENTLETYIVLVFFQPMILGMAGNIGTQSLASTILMLNKDEENERKHIVKELSISLINSIIMALLAVLTVYAFLLVTNSNDDHFLISLVIGISVFLGLFVSSIAGLFLPILINKLGFDERAASGPLLTSVNDLTAVGVYLLTATLILIGI